MLKKPCLEFRAYGVKALVCHGLSVLLVIGTIGVSDRVLAEGKLVPVYPITEKADIPSHRPVLVLPPEITYGSFKVRKFKRDVDIDEEGLVRWIYDIETRVLQGMGLTLLETEGLFEEGVSPDELVAASETIVRGRTLPDDHLDHCGVLREVARERPGMTVLVQHLKIKLAPKGSWDSFSGAMAVGMSNSDLKGALLDCATGEVLWQGEVYVRMVPKVGNARFEAAVAGIFQNLSVVKESRDVTSN